MLTAWDGVMAFQVTPPTGDIVITSGAFWLGAALMTPLVSLIAFLGTRLLGEKERALRDMTEDRDFWRKIAWENNDLGVKAVTAATKMSARGRP